MPVRTRVFAVALCLAGVEVAVASGDGEVLLPAPSLDGRVSVEQALARRRSLRSFAPEALPLAAASQLLWAAQGVTDPAGLRTAPSAGALYPLEVHLVAGAVTGLRPGVYRYEPRPHRLRLESEGDARERVAEASAQDWVAGAPAILVLSAVYERTQRRYGERGSRYVQMEAGHAAQNVSLEAAALGLGTTVVGAFHDDALARALGLPAREEPLALLPVGKAP